MPERLRVATFNLENLGGDDAAEVAGLPPLAARIAALRPVLLRLDADVLCLQEVNGQKPDRHAPRRLDALDALVAGTPYAGFARAFTTGPDGVGPQDVHNLVVLSRFPIRERRQIRHDLVAPPLYRAATAIPPPAEPEPVRWDRPILAVAIELPGGRMLHVVDLHLRAPLAAPIPGQKEGRVWRSTAGWAEGFLIAAMRRAGQAVEARLAVERIFDAEPDAFVVVAGDCNAGLTEMPLRLLIGDADDVGSPALAAARTLTPVERAVPAERRFSMRHRGAALLVDHILVSPALARCVGEVAILNEGLGDDSDESAPPPAGSFHAPLVAGFALP